MKLYFDLLTTLKVIHAESPVVIFFGTYGIAHAFIYTLKITKTFIKIIISMFHFHCYSQSSFTNLNSEVKIFMKCKILLFSCIIANL